MSRPPLLLVAALAACRNDDPPVAPVEPEPPAPVTLLEGRYTGTILGKENDTCGDAFVYDVAPGVLSAEPPDGAEPVFLNVGGPYLAYTSDDRFTITYDGGITQRCTQVGAEVDCKGYESSGSPISVRSKIRDFAITSERSFTQREVVEWDCAGGLCGDVATFPCTMDVLETFEWPLTEVDHCFDRLDNDGDGRADHRDVDCPAFLPEFWSVTGEFGYDESAGGVVPFRVGGVVHPPTVTIGIDAAVYWAGQTYPSRDPSQRCTVTLTYTGTAPIPTTVESVADVDADGEPVTVDRHVFRMPPGQFDVATDCPDQRLFGTETYGTLDDIAAAGWGLGVGATTVPDPAAPDQLGAAARYGIVGEWAAFGVGSGFAVDADLNVLSDAGTVASQLDFDTGGLQVLSGAAVSGSAPLPTGAYLVSPNPTGGLRYGH